jgi:hypothetical protein
LLFDLSLSNSFVVPLYWMTWTENLRSRPWWCTRRSSKTLECTSVRLNWLNLAAGHKTGKFSPQKNWEENQSVHTCSKTAAVDNDYYCSAQQQLPYISLPDCEKKWSDNLQDCLVLFFVVFCSQAKVKLLLSMLWLTLLSSTSACLYFPDPLVYG